MLREATVFTVPILSVTADTITTARQDSTTAEADIMTLLSDDSSMQTARIP